mgnify:CR=1 FL=1
MIFSAKRYFLLKNDFFGQQYLFAQKNDFFGQTIFMSVKKDFFSQKRFFSPKNFVFPNNFFGQKCLLAKGYVKNSVTVDPVERPRNSGSPILKKSLTEKICIKNIFWLKKSFLHKSIFFGRKKSFLHKRIFFGRKNHFCTKKFFGRKKFCQKID